MTAAVPVTERGHNTGLQLVRSLRAPSPGWEARADVVVVGSGIAGLTAALAARELGSVLLVTKTTIEAGATVWAQGGIAAALDPDDSPAQHLADTLVAGAGLCDEEAVRILVEEGPDRVRQLQTLGARFEEDASGQMALTREGGHLRHRIAHAGGDATGREISRVLVDAVRSVQADPAIRVIENAMLLDVLTAADGRACGITLHVLGQGSHDGVGAVLARAVVLATGGFGQVYSSTTNPRVATGDGVAAAIRAGAAVADLEFVQFHPTVLWLGQDAVGQQPLISEAVRGEGAVLRDGEGRRVMLDAHPLADLAPRDVVAKQVLTTMRRDGLPNVWLDARGLGGRHLEDRFPTIVGRCRALGMDPASQLLPVAPAQHYASGGVLTDYDGRTTVPWLYACGEVSCTGVHGANRLASNSLLEGLVWGRRLVERLGRVGLPVQAEPVVHVGPTGLVDPAQRAVIQTGMTAGAGVVRDAEGLGGLLDELQQTEADAPVGRANAAAWEASNLHTVGATLALLALLREESRGGHWRRDYPRRDDVRWCRRQVLRQGPDGTLMLSSTPVGAS